MFSDRFPQALAFAWRLHAGQCRKDGRTPYIAHLLAVAALVMEDGGGEDEAIAALLHDAIEDQGRRFPGGRDGLRAEIERRFGPAVLEIVNACTDDDLYQGTGASKDDPATWRPRKEAYLERLRAISPEARRVSGADKLHNCRSLAVEYRRVGEDLWRRFRTGSAADQLWYQRSLAAAFEETGPESLARQLRAAVGELEAELGG